MVRVQLQYADQANVALSCVPFCDRTIPNPSRAYWIHLHKDQYAFDHSDRSLLWGLKNGLWGTYVLHEGLRIVRVGERDF